MAAAKPTDSKEKLACPMEFEQSAIERDAMIHEENHGKRIDDSEVREYVKTNRDKIFGLQTSFFSELRQKLGENS